RPGLWRALAGGCRPHPEPEPGRARPLEPEPRPDPLCHPALPHRRRRDPGAPTAHWREHQDRGSSLIDSREPPEEHRWMMDDFRPGYPIDLRPDGMRMRESHGYAGDFEAMAARVVARLTGERVLIQDDNSVPGMADLRIEYTDRPTAYVEVVSDVDP